MIFAVVVGLVLALCVTLVVVVAKDPGPAPEEVAVSYELAWDRFDFDVLWTLSGKELHDGLDRKQFLAAKRAAYATQQALVGLVEDVTVDDAAQRGESAVVTTHVTLRDGSTVRNRLRLTRRGRRWVVVSYDLVVDDASRSRAE